MKIFFNYIYYLFTFNSLVSIVNFQEPVTPIMEGIIDLHNYIFFYLIVIFIIISWMFIYILYEFFFISTFFFDFFIKYEFLKKLRQHTGFIHILLLLIWKYSAVPFQIKFIDYLDSLKEIFFFKLLLRSYDYLFTKRIIEHTIIEIVWTIIPSVILILIAIPSFTLLYAMDEIIDPQLTIKIIGYQWFWNYEYATEFKNFIYFSEKMDLSNYYFQQFRNYLNYDSIMYSYDDLPFGFHRLLDVDHQLILPEKIYIRLLITGGDVIHSWSVPALGIKMDAVPGRINQVGIFIKKIGVYYGQCSELCGVNHGFMPIAVKVFTLNNFDKWYLTTNIFYKVL